MEAVLERERNESILEFWQNYIAMFKKNTPEENNFVYDLYGEKILLIRKHDEVRLLWFDEDSNEIQVYYENDFRILEDIIMEKQDKVMNLSRKADFILNMICVKYQLHYISDARFIKLEKEKIGFIVHETDKAIRDYILRYIS